MVYLLVRKFVRKHQFDLELVIEASQRLVLQRLIPFESGRHGRGDQRRDFLAVWRITPIHAAPHVCGFIALPRSLVVGLDDFLEAT
jgi:hypothetical protein